MMTVTTPKKTVRPIPEGLILLTPKPKPAPIDNTELVQAFRDTGGRLLHLRPFTFDMAPSRGITVAFKIRSGHIEVATSVQHKSDVFTKKLGTRVAIDHFNQGRTICIPNRSGKDHRAVLDNLRVAFNVLV